ncbi:MAG: hypothetical protein WBL93_12835 [Lutisporaceae bacterium]
MINHIDKNKQNQIRRFHFYDDAIRTLLSDLLVRTIIMDTYNIGNMQISFKQNQYGKPYIAGFSSFHYNVSHSGDWIVCITDEDTVDIDIENK